MSRPLLQGMVTVITNRSGGGRDESVQRHAPARTAGGSGVAVMLALGPTASSAQAGQYSVSTCFGSSQSVVRREAPRVFASGGMLISGECG